MEERERKAVRALVSVTTQYLHSREGLIDSQATPRPRTRLKR